MTEPEISNGTSHLEAGSSNGAVRGNARGSQDEKRAIIASVVESASTHFHEIGKTLGHNSSGATGGYVKADRQ